MALGALTRPDVLNLLERFSASSDLTVVVGAGASVEATLPAWSTLLDKMLARAAENMPALSSEADRLEWVEETKRKDTLLGAGAVVEAVSGGHLEELLLEALFGKSGPAGFEPGPIARQVARLRLDGKESVTVLTTNYDDLLERALHVEGAPKGRVRSYVGRRSAPGGKVGVTHLHGYAGRDARKGALILSEEHYHQMQQATSWQEQLMLSRLNGSDCLFIGSSLSDPNLIRYLYGAARRSGRHRAAIFIRQEDDLSPHVREGRELATAARWKRCGVETVFLDHFCDVAQFVYEVGHWQTVRSSGAGYQPLVGRARAWLDVVGKKWFPTGSRVQFQAEQTDLSDRLSALLERGLSSARRLGARRSPGEQLQLVAWLADPEGKFLTAWGHSDRAHRDPRTVEPVPIAADSNWVAVRAFCQGTTFERDRDVYASRWKYVRGIPLILKHPTRLPVGCISIASTLPGRRTVLKRMDESVRAEFNSFLTAGTLDLLQPGAR